MGLSAYGDPENSLGIALNGAQLELWQRRGNKTTTQTTGVAAMVIHGTADTTVPFPSGEHDANYWATVNGCASGYTASSPSPCQARNACPGDKPVVYCPIDGLGHALWDQSASAAWSFISSL